MDPITINQTTINHAMRVHNYCMELCLHPESELYQIHASVRELMVQECCAMANHAKRYHAHINRFNVPYPIRIRLQREREAR